MKTKVSNNYTKMTSAEHSQSTKEFDVEFAADKFHPMSPEDRQRWERVKSKSKAAVRSAEMKRISIHVEKDLLQRSDVLAKRKGMSRDMLIERALQTVLVADGE